jgi:amino acid transporter
MSRADFIVMVAELAIVVLAVWYVVKTLFFRRAAPRTTRGSHIGDAFLMLVVAALWAGLCFLVLLGAAFGGANAAVTGGIWIIGGGIMLGLLWGAGRHLWQALPDAGSPPANPQQELPGKPDTPRESAPCNPPGR